MKLKNITIKGYKSLKNVELRFTPQNTSTSLNFFIGINGSGKSTMMEAIGLIFSRIMQNELPGFYFEISYIMPENIVIEIKTVKKNLDSNNWNKADIFIEKDGEVKQYSSLPREYMPDRIISYCSGANNSMEDILIISPKKSIISDLYDAVYKNNIDDSQIEELLTYYEQLDTNPRAIYLDDITAKLTLPVLFSILPIDLRSENSEKDLDWYFNLRKKLTDHLQYMLIPIAFSLTVNCDKLDQSAETPQHNILSRLVDISDNNLYINDWVTERPSFDSINGNAQEKVAVFLLTPKDKESNISLYHPGLNSMFNGDPLTLLSILLTCYKDGILKDVQFYFKNDGVSELLNIDSLSDGELMWLSRMGLILLSQKHCSKNTLFLFDEPDVHFNDDWNKDFIQMVYKANKDTTHEFIIATHSTLILTDALHEQLYLFHCEPSNGSYTEQVSISTFAAQREQISTQVFGASSIGTYAHETVTKMMHDESLEKILESISVLGPGYQRFRMYERYYSIRDKKQ